MFPLHEFRSGFRPLADRLSWAAMLRPDVVLDKNGAFLAVLSYLPRDLASSTKNELVASRWHLNNAIRRFGSGWGLWFEAQRNASDDYPESAWPDALSARLDDERRKGVQAEGGQHETAHFIAILYSPPSERLGKIEALVLENLPERRSADARYRTELAKFLEEVETFRAVLSSFMPRVRLLSGDALATYLHSTISTKRHPVRMPALPVFLDGWLPDCGWVGGRQPMLGGHHLRTITIRQLPMETQPGLLDALNRLPFAYRWAVRWLPMDKPEGDAVLATLWRNWLTQRRGIIGILRAAIFKEEATRYNPEADAKAGEVESALGETGAGEISLGLFTATITVTHPDRDRLEANVRQVEKIVNALGMVAAVEVWDTLGAWCGSLPGNAYADVARAPVLSPNLADLIPATAVWAGPERDHHLDGPELLRCVSDGGTAFRFVMHPDGSDVGHGLIVGVTGAGKSTLVAAMMAGWRRYPGSRVIIFDRGASARAMTLGLGGDFHSLAGDDSGVSLQPLARVDDEGEAQWAAAWLADVIAGQSVEITPELRREVWQTLRAMAGSPPEHRTLTHFRQLVQNEAVKAAIEPFTLRGANPMLDADMERIDVADVACFETAGLMERPSAVGPVLAYVFHALERGFDGRPVLLVVDEAWQALQSPILSSRLRTWLKTARKQNVAVWLSTQSLSDIANSPISAVVIESTLSRIFLANEAAQTAGNRAAYERIGLNTAQIELISRMLPKREYFFASAAGNRMFQLGLSPLELAFAGASRPEHHHEMDALLTSHPREEFAARWAYLRGVREDWTIAPGGAWSAAAE